MVNRKRLLETFMEYVRIDSESGDEREMCLKVEKDLKDLGADVIRQGHGQDTHSNGWNLLCTLKGSPGQMCIRDSHPGSPWRSPSHNHPA